MKFASSVMHLTRRPDFDELQMLIRREKQNRALRRRACACLRRSVEVVFRRIHSPSGIVCGQTWSQSKFGVLRETLVECGPNCPPTLELGFEARTSNK